MASNGTSSNSNEAASKGKGDRFSEILTCGICLSRMNLPCCLPCAHSFCRSCLLDYARNNNISASTPINYILCPYCKYQLNFRSFEHFESMLIINPTLKQLCEALDGSGPNSEQSQFQSNNLYRARCHACCLLKMLKACKHCCFMLCETCRRTHLLDVHRESKAQLDVLESYLSFVNKKRLEMHKLVQEYTSMRQRINDFAEKLIHDIEQQRDDALHMINERQHSNDELFWRSNGFDNSEKLDFFVALFETGQKKLSAKNITDKELMDLSDNLQTIPNIDETKIESIKFSQLSLELDETVSTKEFIRICEHDVPTSATDFSEKSTGDPIEQPECIQT